MRREISQASWIWSRVQLQDVVDSLMFELGWKDPAKELTWLEFSAWELAKEIKIDLKRPVTGDVFIKKPLHAPRVSSFLCRPRLQSQLTSMAPEERKAAAQSWPLIGCCIIMTRSDLYLFMSKWICHVFLLPQHLPFPALPDLSMLCPLHVFWTLHPLYPVFWSVSQTYSLGLWGLFHQHLQCHVHALLTFDFSWYV